MNSDHSQSKTNPDTSDLRGVLGVDTGGTFTDFVCLLANELTIHKVLSTPHAPEQAILQGISEMGLNDLMASGHLTIVHGSTVATNAALEGKGAKTVFITNRGFKDLLTIGRQIRKELYNLTPSYTPPPVPPEQCLESGGRVGAQGETIDPLCEQDINAIQQQLEELQPEAVAINFLFSFLDGSHEKRLADAIPSRYFTSYSSQVLPEYKEYERGIATWLNASLGPKVAHYLKRLQQGTAPSSISMMQSTGGTVALDYAANNAVRLLLSGPAGGLSGAKYIGELANTPSLLTFDMGGTSTDVAMINQGELKLTNEGRIGPYPVAVPMVDMHTIGAGGGSIAYLDQGGMLQVGPESAGSAPGPACYGKGGQRPTVTDANAVLGRLRPRYFLGGRMSLDLDAAINAIQPLADQLNLSLEETALGIIKIANNHMTQALRLISVERGYNPKHFHLCCFGGAGGLHVCELAESLQMEQAIVPIHGGVLSALGMLAANTERHLSKAFPNLLSNVQASDINHHLESLKQQGLAQLQQEMGNALGNSNAIINYSMDLRYRGQSFTLNLSWDNHSTPATTKDAFSHLHRQRFGHALASDVEIVTLRCAIALQKDPLVIPTLEQKSSAAPVEEIALFAVSDQAVPVYERRTLGAGSPIQGPALVVEQVSTTLIGAGWQGSMDAFGNLLLSRS